jgi:hypothetical protein
MRGCLWIVLYFSTLLAISLYISLNSLAVVSGEASVRFFTWI